ncbi:MAG: NADH-quinone oxidoreductase subunit NuoN [Gammaproteobacteria bacterium]|nr:NADH-quinone oxidoreductase subunit NuoN [Gammaproteobacteria bacterium]
MPFHFSDFQFFLPEIWVAGAVCVILLVECFDFKEKHKWIYGLTQATLLGALLLTLPLWWMEKRVVLNGMFAADKLATVAKGIIYLVTAMALVYAREYVHVRNFEKSEYYVLTLTAVLGMMVIVSGAHLLSLYLGIELLSLSLYALIAMRRDSSLALEAALKFFVIGALGSGLLLYGISMIYGVSAHLDIRSVAEFAAETSESRLMLMLGVVFIISGLAFKLGSVPFHMWVPDVYQGSPTSVTAFISSAPKVAAFGLVARFLMEAFPVLHGEWQQFLLILAISSMALGNIIAIAQTNIKRMLAYSAITHMGFFLLGVLVGTGQGNAAALFYIMAYVLMSLGAFGMVIFMSRAGVEAEKIDDFKGLNAVHPWYAFIMMVLMFSLAGVPPTVGFYAKLSVLKSIIDVDMVWLAVVAVIFALMGAYYYLRVVKTVYFDAPGKNLERFVLPPRDLRVVLSLNGLAIIGLGLFPYGLMLLCQQVFA